MVQRYYLVRRFCIWSLAKLSSWRTLS